MMTAIPADIIALAGHVQDGLADVFKGFDAVAEYNTARVMDAFAAERVSDSCFAGTTGYGYDDMGRETLDRVWARLFSSESACVRTGFANGTHAIASALFAAVKPGEILLSATGAPYDTLRTVIGDAERKHGTLAFYGVDFEQVDFAADGSPDRQGIADAAANRRVGAVLVQRSRGYSSRRALSVPDIGDICAIVHRVNPNAVVVVDNCYGEFTEKSEPCSVGADICAGSLIKNPGGGIAPAGGYVAGRAALVERAAERLTTPGIGGEVGATLGQNRLLFQGLFLAPHTVAQALKTAAFCAGMLEEFGYRTSPPSRGARSDIIQMVELGTAERLCAFCAGIQHASPVDSFVTPEPWAMPGYDCEVVMAAGAFIQGSSIELSADGPLREPYAAYMQGGLTYESGKLAVMRAIASLQDAPGRPSR